MKQGKRIGKEKRYDDRSVNIVFYTLSKEADKSVFEQACELLESLVTDIRKEALLEDEKIRLLLTKRGWNQNV